MIFLFLFLRKVIVLVLTNICESISLSARELFSCIHLLFSRLLWIFSPDSITCYVVISSSFKWSPSNIACALDLSWCNTFTLSTTWTSNSGIWRIEKPSNKPTYPPILPTNEWISIALQNFGKLTLPFQYKW